MQDSIFTKIIKGEIPCHKVYEDDKVIAFLDINPFTPGHTLVVPKKQTDHLWDLEPDLYQHVMVVAQKVANKQREVLQPKRVGMAVEGFAIPHAHVHVFPTNVGLKDTVNAPKLELTQPQLAEMAAKLRLPDGV